MRRNLELAVWPKPNDCELALLEIEIALLGRLEPPLNLRDVLTPWTAHVRQLARGWRTRRGSGGRHDCRSRLSPALPRNAGVSAQRARGRGSGRLGSFGSHGRGRRRLPSPFKSERFCSAPDPFPTEVDHAYRGRRPRRDPAAPPGYRARPRCQGGVGLTSRLRRRPPSPAPVARRPDAQRNGGSFGSIVANMTPAEAPVIALDRG